MFRALYEVYKSGNDRRRLAHYMAPTVNRDVEDIRQALKDNDDSIYQMFELTAKHLVAKIKNRQLEPHEIKYSERYDQVSQKQRLIGRQHVESRILDHAMVNVLQDLFRRIGAGQFASIPGRGQVAGATKIAKWLRNPKMKYFVKMDVRKCYESLEPHMVYNKVADRVEDWDILYVLHVLLSTHTHGMSIGSYLSQWLCNYCMSDAYHFVTEKCLKTRREKTTCMVNHVLFYMDDMLLLGTNKRAIFKAATALQEFLATDMKVEVKPWRLNCVNHIAHDESWFIDMMGYRCHRGYLTIRRKTWLRVRRTFIRATKYRKAMPLKLARRLLSYYGYIKHAGRHMLQRHPEWVKALECAKYTVSQWSKNNAKIAAQL